MISLEKILDLVYPPFCLFCRGRLQKGVYILCAGCQSELILLETEERCPLCFSSGIKKGRCHVCKKKRPLLTRGASAFAASSPASCLLKRVSKFGQTYLAEGLAAWMTIQFLHLHFPLPDLILPCPSSFLEKLFLGESFSSLAAKTIQKIFGKKKRADTLEDKTILIIGDEMGEGCPLFSFASDLIKNRPKGIYALALLQQHE